MLVIGRGKKKKSYEATDRQTIKDGWENVSRQAAKLKSSPNELNDPQMHNQLSRSWMDERLSGDKKVGRGCFSSRPPRHRGPTLGRASVRTGS